MLIEDIVAIKNSIFTKNFLLWIAVHVVTKRTRRVERRSSQHLL